MSNCINQVFLSGVCGRDPDIRTTTGGTTIAAFSIAASESRKDGQGAWQETTAWVNLKGFGRVAELTKEKVKKGTRVFLEGKLTVEEWNDKKTGEKKSKTVVVITYLSVVPTARSAGVAAPQRPSESLPPERANLEISDLDIPF